MKDLERLVYGFGDTPHGRIVVARSESGIRAVLFGADNAALAEDLAARFPDADLVPAGMGMDRAIAQVVDVMLGEAPVGELVLDLKGTAFQLAVWDALRAIQPGDTASYAEVAAAIGKPGAVRAVAAACAANPVAVIVPCHRVVRSDGSLSGYRWGVERKRALLAWETAA
ncbi:methylated-DNA--[protein]-cysteine S-methyltransferase [Hyphomonas chukchiensis]|nr:methylated-DNA--[protein]-cysteine S-methyltransferase [Hyphomonas chukchiensis]